MNDKELRAKLLSDDPLTSLSEEQLEQVDRYIDALIALCDLAKRCPPLKQKEMTNKKSHASLNGKES